jgi:plastocyanin
MKDKITTMPSTNNIASEPPAHSKEPQKMRMTPKKALAAGLSFCALLLVVVLIINATSHNSKNTSPGSTSANRPLVAKVELSASGFSPATLSVKKGTMVEWQSTDSGEVHIVASNPYPSDNELPALKSKQFGQGVTYSYKFDQTGTFNYHDDLHPTLNGTVVVE